MREGEDDRQGSRERQSRVQFPGAGGLKEVEGVCHCGSAEESVIISSISDKGSVINTDLVSGSPLVSPRAACDAVQD